MLTSLTLCSISEPGGKSMTKLRIFLKQIVNTAVRRQKSSVPGRSDCFCRAQCVLKKERGLRCIGILAS